MRSLGILFLCLIQYSSSVQIESLPPRIREVLKPYLKGPGSQALIDNLYSKVYTAPSYRWKQERAIHVLLDGIVKEVEGSLAVIDEHFNHEKQLLKDIRVAKYNELEQATADAQKELDAVNAKLVQAEKRKIKADETYNEKTGAKTAAEKAEAAAKAAEISGKAEADRVYKKRYKEIDAQHNETRQQYVDELMFVAKLRQMIEQLNVEYKHKRGAGATAAPTVAPTPAPTAPTPSPTTSPTPSPTLLNNLDGTSGWRLVAREVPHHEGQLRDLGRRFGFYDDPSFNLGPTFKFARDYTEVAFTWGGPRNFVRFIASEDFFDDHVKTAMNIWHVVSSQDQANKIFDGEAGLACRAAVKPGGGDHHAGKQSRPGLTSWGITPVNDNNRDCGCSNSNNVGTGFYYGGTPNSCTGSCGCKGGGFTGYVATGQKHSDVSLGKTLEIWIRKGLWRVLSGVHATEDGKKITKHSPTSGKYRATAVSADACLSVSASAVSKDKNVQFGLTLLTEGGVMRTNDVVPNWAMRFSSKGTVILSEFGADVTTIDAMSEDDKYVLGSKDLPYELGDVGNLRIENGYVQVFFKGAKIHTFNTPVDVATEGTKAQFSFLEEGAGINVKEMLTMGNWVAYKGSCQGNNKQCEMKTQEKCIMKCYNDASCSMYMYNQRTGGCCTESCFPPAFTPSVPKSFNTCDAWIKNCTQGWSSYVKDYAKA